MTRKEDEITLSLKKIWFFLFVSQANEIQRSIAVARKNMPNKLALDNELVTLQIQVS